MHKPPSATLYCLPFAGGNALSYRALPTYIADNIDLRMLELPGRNKKIREPLATNIDDLVDVLFQEIKAELTSTYALFGHSMGALLVYLLTQRIEAEGLLPPLHLFCSGRRAPSVSTDKIPRHLLPKQEFLAHLDKLGGIPDEVRRHEELMDFFEPIIRADLQANDTYQYLKVPPLNQPMTVLYGLQDEETPPHHILPWQQETRLPVAIKPYPGGHFFIFDHLPQLGQLFSDTLNSN